MSDSVRERRRRFGQRLAARRAELGLTQEEVADVLGVTQGRISQYERGEVVSHTPEDFASLARALRVIPSEIARWAEYGIDVVGEDMRQDRYAHLDLPPDVTDGELLMLKHLFRGLRSYEAEAEAEADEAPDEARSGRGRLRARA
jgi:transcriptional regulator with XRE-family HTH domain